MMILVLITFLGGAVLGQRCKVLMLLPAIACVLPVAIGVGVAQSGNLWPTLMTVVAAIASLQIGYLAGMGVRYALAVARLRELRRSSLAGSHPVRRPAH